MFLEAISYLKWIFLGIIFFGYFCFRILKLVKEDKQRNERIKELAKEYKQRNERIKELENKLRGLK